MKLTTVLIITYNSSAVIADCLAGLAASASHGWLEILIVDNASIDNTLEIVERVQPNARVIKNSSNTGFARAVNLGAKRAKGDVLILLNPDTQATGDVIQKLSTLAYTRGNEIHAPLIVHPGDRLAIVSAGHFPTAWRMFTHYSGVARLARWRAFQGHYLFPDQLFHEHRVDWATGACLAIRKTAWDELGGLTEKWFMYAEDLEFCWRANKRNVSTTLHSGIEVVHAAGTGTSDRASMSADWVTNLWRFYEDDISGSKFLSLLWRIIVSGGLFSRGVVYKFRSVQGRNDAYWRHESTRFFSFSSALLRAKNP